MVVAKHCFSSEHIKPPLVISVDKNLGVGKRGGNKSTSKAFGISVADSPKAKIIREIS
jgi:hypothetical protein